MLLSKPGFWLSGAPRRVYTHQFWDGVELFEERVRIFARRRACKRHASSAPGPLEARRRAAKRHMVNFAPTPYPFTLPSLFDLQAKSRERSEKVTVEGKDDRNDRTSLGFMIRQHLDYRHPPQLVCHCQSCLARYAELYSAVLYSMSKQKTHRPCYVCRLMTLTYLWRRS